jgi:hypothetical protein
MHIIRARASRTAGRTLARVETNELATSRGGRCFCSRAPKEPRTSFVLNLDEIFNYELTRREMFRRMRMKANNEVGAKCSGRASTPTRGPLVSLRRLTKPPSDLAEGLYRAQILLCNGVLLQRKFTA